jgi:hypothetical protein
MANFLFLFISIGVSAAHYHFDQMDCVGNFTVNKVLYSNGCENTSNENFYDISAYNYYQCVNTA